jgi:DNA-binding beta-propeller fold protein YncE
MASRASTPTRAGYCGQVPARFCAVLAVILAALMAGCGSAAKSPTTTAKPATSSTATSTHAATGIGRADSPSVYAHDGPGDLAPAVRSDPALVYVPNSQSNSVYEISQKTFKIVRKFSTGALPQHVTPSWDLGRLYVDNDDGNSLTPIDPRTGRPGAPIPVEDPYNLYFTPDGRFAIVVAERLQRLDFRTPSTMRLVHSLAVSNCAGVDHADFSADGRYMYASCEFAGRMIELDLRRQQVVRTLVLAGGNSSPQDVKLSPDGGVLYVADQAGGGLWEIDAHRFSVIGFLHTGAGAHGLYPSRDARFLYVSNRAAGTISVVSFARRRVVTTWRLPPPASPDMGGVSADGQTLWLSGRYNAEVYAIDTRSGQLRARIPVGLGPHGLCVWPQPGRYSLGHTGIMR